MKFTRNSIYFIALSVLTIFHIANNVVVLHSDTVPVSDEVSGHFIKSLQVYSWDLIDKLFIKEFDYPPLFYYTSLPLYWIFGKDQDVAAMTNVPYLIILIFSVYGIGKVLQSRMAGLLASFIVSTFIAVYGFSRVYMLEFAMTAMTPLCVYFLLRSKTFSNRWYSFLFGISCGFGLLVKFSLPVYIMGPVVVALYKMISIKKIMALDSTFFKRARNILLAIASLMIVSSPWYAINLAEMSNRSQYFSGRYLPGEYGIQYQDREDMERTIDTAKSRLTSDILLYYITILYNYQIGYFYFGLLILSILYHILFFREGNVVLLLWFSLPMLLFTAVYVLSTLHEPRFIMPYLSSIAIMIAIMITRLKSTTISTFVMILVFVVGLHQFLAHSYGESWFLRNGLLSGIDLHDTHRRHMYGLMKSEKDQWKSREITHTIYESLKDVSDCNVNVSLFLGFGKFTMSDLQMNLELYYKEELETRGVNIHIIDPYGLCGVGSCILKYDVYEDIVNESDIIIQDNSKTIPSEEDVYSRSMRLMMKSFESNKNQFDFIDEFDLPAGNIIYVFKRKWKKTTTCLGDSR